MAVRMLPDARSVQCMTPACNGSGYGVTRRINEAMIRPDEPPDHCVSKLRRTWVGHLGGPPSARSIIVVPQNGKTAMHGSRPSWPCNPLDRSRGLPFKGGERGCESTCQRMNIGDILSCREQAGSLVCLRPDLLVDVMLIAICVSLGAVCALLATAAASQLRQRHVAALEVEVRRVGRRTSGVRQPCVLAGLMLAIL